MGFPKKLSRTSLNALSKLEVSRIAIFLALILVGCIATEAVPEPRATEPPTMIPTRTWTARPPLSTAAIFELLRTSTPIPTWTPVATRAFQGFGASSSGFPPDVNPLTGLKVSDPLLLERRPMVIKITNFPRSVRPQWGLTKADHVYEYYLEDGMTRFVGIFYGQDASRVGPIRSGRPFDEHLIRMYKGFFAFGFADDRLMDVWMESDLRDFLVFERPGHCPPLCRIGPKNAYNTLYADTQYLSVYVSARDIGNERQDLSGLWFEASPLVTFGGWEVYRLDIRYSRTSHHFWEYDPVEGSYRRWQEADSRDRGEEIYQPLFDSLTDQQITADNIVVLMVPTTYYFKSNSTEIYDIQLKGKGEGYALREGKLFKINWNRPKPKSLIYLTYPNGALYPLKPGNVWFEVLSDVTTFEASDLVWRYYFDIDVPEE